MSDFGARRHDVLTTTLSLSEVKALIELAVPA
jgi:hypothetical protein